MEPYMVIYEIGDHAAACFFKHEENALTFYDTCIEMGHVTEFYERIDNEYRLR